MRHCGLLEPPTQMSDWWTTVAWLLDLMSKLSKAKSQYCAAVDQVKTEWVQHIVSNCVKQSSEQLQMLALHWALELTTDHSRLDLVFLIHTLQYQVTLTYSWGEYFIVNLGNKEVNETKRRFEKSLLGQYLHAWNFSLKKVNTVTFSRVDIAQIRTELIGYFSPVVTRRNSTGTNISTE